MIKSNRNISLEESGFYKGLKVYSKRGPLISEYMDCMMKVLGNSLLEHHRTLAVRLDLRLPKDFKYFDASIMSKFFSSLKSKIAYDLHRKEMKGTRVHKCNLRYFWVKEQSTADLPHFHVVIFLNYNTYMGLGNYESDNNSNLAARIKAAWASALSVPIATAGPLVEFPRNCQYRLFFSAANFEITKNNLIFRMSYLAKLDSKRFGSRQRNVGYSLS